MALRKTATMALFAVTIIGLFLALSTIGVIGTPRGSGKVSAVNVGVYLDSSCTVNCTSINWGNIDPCSAVTKTVYVKNLGTVAVVLRIGTRNWNPTEAASLVTLSWNLNNYVLAAGEVVPAVFTLALASNTGSLGDFSFVVVITGTQQKR
jgi:hypothetical protein